MMSFDDFLGNLNENESRKKQVEAEKPKRKSDYLTYIDQAYAHIANCLKPYSDAGKLSLSYGSGYSNDDDLGHMEVKTLTVTVGGRGARFSPIASIGFGCGCIIEIKPTVTSHFSGPKRDMSLIRKGNSGDISDWKFRAPEEQVTMVRGQAQPSEMKYYDFTTESIQSVLQRLMQ